MWFQGHVQGREHVRVELYGVNELCPLGEDGGEGASARSYLENDVVVGNASSNDAGSVRVY